MRIGFMREIKKGLYKTLNGRITIALTSKKGHIHIKVTGEMRFALLTNISDKLTRLELLALASYVFQRISAFNHYRKDVAKQYLKSELDTNYTSVFGSLWLGGRK